jgi:hypothetical protein
VTLHHTLRDYSPVEVTTSRIPSETTLTNSAFCHTIFARVSYECQKQTATIPQLSIKTDVECVLCEVQN